MSHYRQINTALAVASAIIATVSQTSAQEGTYEVRFGQTEYLAAESAGFTSDIIIDPVPPGGLFSYGLAVEVQSASGIAGVINLLPSDTLNFNGVKGAGAIVASITGGASARGTSDFFAVAKTNHTAGVIASFDAMSLPVDDYTLQLRPFRTLGQGEQLFIGGNCVVLDPDINFGSASLAIVEGFPEGELSLLEGLVPDRQTGLLLQRARLTNIGQLPGDVFRIFVHDLDPNIVALNNGHGEVAGIPFFEIARTLGPGEEVDLTIEFLSMDRTTIPSPRYVVEVVPDEAGPQVTGTELALTPRVSLPNGDVLLEFSTRSGVDYFIRYSDDGMQTWTLVRPPVRGTGGKRQWIDNGLPKTASHPGEVGSRFYQLVVPVED